MKAATAINTTPIASPPTRLKLVERGELRVFVHGYVTPQEGPTTLTLGADASMRYYPPSWEWSSTKSQDQTGLRRSAHRRIYSTASPDVTWLAFARYVGGYSGAAPPAANERHQLNTERLETHCAINHRVGSRLLPVPRDIVRKCGGSALENDSISIAYEFRTKSAQSGGLEKNGWRDGILVSADALQSGGFRAKPVVIGLCALASPRRMLDADRLAEGEELGFNVLQLA